MPHCAVIWCNNQSKNVNKKKNGVSYHKFPHDPQIKDKWIRATGKCDWLPQKHDTVCSEHFAVDSFMKKASKTYLFLDAIPTLKLHPIFDEIDSITNTINIVNAAVITSSKRRKKKKNSPGLATAEGCPSLVTTVHIKKKITSDTATEAQLTEEDGALDLATTVEIKREDPLALVEDIDKVPPTESPKVGRALREAYYTVNPHDSPQTRQLKRSLKAAQETIRRQRLQVKRFRESNRRLTTKVAKLENIVKSLREQSADN